MCTDCWEVPAAAAEATASTATADSAMSPAPTGFIFWLDPSSCWEFKKNHKNRGEDKVIVCVVWILKFAVVSYSAAFHAHRTRLYTAPIQANELTARTPPLERHDIKDTSATMSTVIRRRPFIIEWINGTVMNSTTWRRRKRLTVLQPTTWFSFLEDLWRSLLDDQQPGLVVATAPLRCSLVGQLKSMNT